MTELEETSTIAPATDPTRSPSEEEIAPVEEESDPFTESPPNQSPESTPNQSPEPPSTPPRPNCIDFVTQVRHFSDALSAFYRCYDDLQTHLDEIKSAIDYKLASRVSSAALLLSTPAQVNEKNPDVVTGVAVPTPSLNPSEEVETENENSVKHASTELESHCEEMSSRDLRKYFVANLAEPDKLREEVPKALKFALDPAKLIIESSGRFFLQRSKAYAVNSSLITAREVAILMWECFLLMENENSAVRIDKEVREESEKSAKAWRKRLITEGGLSQACEIEARGFLMFLGCFGVPGLFRFEDIRDLINAANVKDILSLLKRSSLLMKKIADAIEGLAKNKMGVDAVDLAYTLEVQDKITPQTILAWFLRDAKDSWKRAKKSSRDAPGPMNEANKKLLAALRSLVKCAESHEIDVGKLIPGWQVHEMISSVENNIAEFEKNKNDKALQKRRANEMDSSNKVNNLESKRIRHTVHGLPLRNVPTADSQRNLLDRIPGHTSSSFASPSLLHGAGAGLLPETISGSAVGIGNSSVLAGAPSHLQTGPYAGSHGESLIDKSGRVVSYGNQHYGMHGDVGYEERVAGYAYGGQPSPIGLNASYRASPSMEGFPGYPSSSTVGVSSRSSASDLYQFADAVIESDPYHGRASGPVGSVPSVVPAHHHS